jgi:hypothetical protein
VLDFSNFATKDFPFVLGNNTQRFSQVYSPSASIPCMANYIDFSHGGQLLAKTLFSSMPHFASVHLILEAHQGEGQSLKSTLLLNK